MSRYLIYDNENLKSYQGLYPSCFINSSNGKVMSNGQLSSTSYIRVNEGDIVEIEGTFYPNVGAFYNADKTYISGIAKTDVNGITAPTNAKYLRVCGETGKSLKVYITSNNISDLGNDTYKEELIFSSKNPTVTVKEGNTINYRNGNFFSASDCNCTEDYLSVIPSSNVVLYGGFPNSCGAFYNESNAFVSGIFGGKNEIDVIVPETATKMKFGYNTNTPAYAIVITKENVTLGDDSGGGTEQPTTYTITNNLTNVTNSNSIETVEEGSSYSATLSPSGGYEISTVTVTMGESDVTSSVYSNGSINITNVTGNIIITATAIESSTEATSYTITKNLTNVTINNSLSSINEGSSYSAILTANSGYALGTVTVTMGGNDITSSTYSNGSINISNVTGNIVITASGVSIPVIILSTTSLSIAENATGTFTVKLDKAPSSTATVNLSASNSNITLDKTSLSFTTNNYSTAQTITVTGSHDASSYSSKTSVITVSSEGLTSKTINITVTNIDEQPEEEVKTSNNMILSEYIRKNIKALIFDSSKENNYFIINGVIIKNDTGELGANIYFATTDFIKVFPGDTIELTGTYPTSSGAFYNTDKTYNSKISLSGSAPYTLTVPDNAYYFRVSYNVSTTSTIYVTRNSANYSLENNTYLDATKMLYGNTIISNELTDLYKNINKYKGKTWDVYGDSITEPNYRTAQNYQYFVASKLGIGTVNNYGVSGDGFKQLANRISEKTSNPDLITVFCGTNNFGCVHEQSALGNITDTSSTESVTGYIRLTIEKLLAKYPCTPIGFFTPLPRANGNSVNKQVSTGGYTMEQLADRIIEICGEYSIPVLDLYRCSNLRPWIPENKAKYFSCSRTVDGDGLHPNVIGHEYFIAPKVTNFIKTLL